MNILNKKKKHTYIIAEVGINHNGSLKNCIKLIKAGAKSGVDAVKFQNWLVDDFITDKKQIFYYKSKGRLKKESFYNLCKRNELKKSWIKELNKCCKAEGVDFMSTPTSNDGIDELKKFKLKYIKNGSDYLTNLELIKHMAKNFKKIILSTGMSYEEDIALAIKAIRSLKKNNEIILLHCTSMYPTTLQNINLNRMTAIKNKFKLTTGFSDHTLGREASIQAVTLGAEYLEKHITLNHNMEGPDHWFSLDPDELKKYVEKVREAEISLGRFSIVPAKDEMKNLKEQRLSVFSNQTIKKGEKLKIKHIDFKKPGTGIKPNKIYNFLGKKLKKKIKANTVLKLKNFI